MRPETPPTRETPPGLRCGAAPQPGGPGNWGAASRSESVLPPGRGQLDPVALSAGLPPGAPALYTPATPPSNAKRQEGE